MQKVGCKSGPHAKVRSQNYVHAKVGCKSEMQKWASPVNTTLIRDPCTRPLHVRKLTVSPLRLVIRCENFYNLFSERCNFWLEIAQNLKLCIHRVLLTIYVLAMFRFFFNDYFESYKSLLWRTQNFVFSILEKLNEWLGLWWFQLSIRGNLKLKWRDFSIEAVLKSCQRFYTEIGYFRHKFGGIRESVNFEI